MGSIKDSMGLRARRRWAWGSLAAASGLALLAWVDTDPLSRGAPAECREMEHEHRGFTELLRKYTEDGKVDYRALGREGREQLELYLSELEAVCPPDYDAWNRQQKLAFWINAYNAYTLKLIIDQPKLESIRRVGLLPGAAWRKRFIPMNNLRGEMMSLNQIEHDILRGELFEPRIHFAIVCASKSCPILESRAFTASELDERLDAATRRFINDPERNDLDADDGRIELSKIFKWFRSDFERDGGRLEDFVASYAEDPDALSSDAEIEFRDYDWSLNEE